MQIVMAEHDPRQRAQIRQRLEGAGEYEIHEAENCMMALRLAREQPPDLILMGFGRAWEETILAVRMLESDQVAPVLLWTACAAPHAIAAAVAAGAVGCLAEACTPKELKAQVEIGVARWREKRHLARQVAALHEQLETQRLVSQAKGLMMQWEPGLTEEEAHRRLRKQSMDSRTSMRALAEAILAQRPADDGARRSERGPALAAAPVTARAPL
jgi:two-component system, response regulator PdtaR